MVRTSAKASPFSLVTTFKLRIGVDGAVEETVNELCCPAQRLYRKLQLNQLRDLSHTVTDADCTVVVSQRQHPSGAAHVTM